MSHSPLSEMIHGLHVILAKAEQLQRDQAVSVRPPMPAPTKHPVGPGNYNQLTAEGDVFTRAIVATSNTNWIVGECAAVWMKWFSRGRTDTDFGEIVGLSSDQVYQRRRVWETFGDVYANYPGLRWSHFYAALNWDDAASCLQWAQDIGATVAEMRAWRRAQRGEDLSHPEPMPGKMF